MTNDGLGHAFTFDAESRIAQVNSGAVNYVYDGDGNRVRKDVSGQASTEYYYFGGNIIAEVNISTSGWTNYVFLGGERVARMDSTGVFYYFSDHLKTASVITDSAGNIKSESDFYPWGGELQFVNNDSNHYKFTGKERDSETQLDYFGARYYSNGLGRFVTPDWAAKATAVPYAEFADPQSLNLYSYVRNVPTTRFDPDGHQETQRGRPPVEEEELNRKEDEAENKEADKAEQKQEEKERGEEASKNERDAQDKTKGGYDDVLGRCNGGCKRNCVNAIGDRRIGTMAIDKKLIDQLLAEYKKPEDIIGEDGLLKQLTKAILERALQAELSEHLGYEKHDPAGRNSGNSRNGSSRKKLQGNFGELELETPVGKGQTRFSGFDDQIISMYARGMSTREIQGHLEEIYGVEVSPTLISNVTDGVLEEVRAWQNSALESVYGLMYLDALRVKVRDSGRIENQAIYVVLGVNLEGRKEVLGLWAAQQEGAKFWLQVLTELQSRGVKDILIACVDGLKGFPEAIEALFPQAEVQLCIVHMVRAALKYVPWQHRKAAAEDLRRVYQSATAEEGEHHLRELEQKWKDYPSLSQVWWRNWEHIRPLFQYPLAIRKAMYTTNAVESLNRCLRKIIKTRGAFPHEDAAIKLLYLALRLAAKKWTMPIRNWKEALNYFIVLWPDRIPAAEKMLPATCES